MLRPTSLFALLTGFGIYLGFIWTRNLDTNARRNDSSNVLVVYVVALGLCLGVYSILPAIQNAGFRTETAIVNDYLQEYIEKYLLVPSQRAVKTRIDKGVVMFDSLFTDNAVEVEDRKPTCRQILRTTPRHSSLLNLPDREVPPTLQLSLALGYFVSYYKSRQ
jgi:hypothetical protein